MCSPSTARSATGGSADAATAAMAAALRLLSALLLNTDNRDRFARCGGLDTIVAVMRVCPSRRLSASARSAHVHACKALRLLASGCDARKRECVRQGAAGALATVMRLWPQEEAVQWQACWAVMNLCSCTDLCPAVLADGCLPAVRQPLCAAAVAMR